MNRYALHVQGFPRASTGSRTQAGLKTLETALSSGRSLRALSGMSRALLALLSCAVVGLAVPSIQAQETPKSEQAALASGKAQTDTTSTGNAVSDKAMDAPTLSDSTEFVSPSASATPMAPASAGVAKSSASHVPGHWPYTLTLPSLVSPRSASLARGALCQAAPPAPAEPTTRALPSPIDNPPFPMTDWTVNNGTPIGESWDVAPGALQHLLFGKKLDNTHWRITGWLDTAYVASSSRNSNLPTTYALVPNHPEIDQLVIEVQKMPDTVQKRYIDWGFMSAHLAGIDYRFTSAKGWLDDQLLSHNNLYGYDPVLQYGLIYFPKIADGSVLQFGRYISPIDIEAQLTNSNYLFSHSLMFGVDPYTYTGVNLQVRVNKHFMYDIGVHSGNENAFWSGAGNFNGEFLAGWNSDDNKDALWGGLDSIGDGRTRKEHDNEQIVNFTWGHKFNDRWHMQTQIYYMWQYDALKGGTAINGPVYPYGGGGGPGAVIPGKANAYGYVNYIEYKVNKRDYISFRDGYLGDGTGWRTGFNNRFMDFTLGYSHLFSANYWFRPEIRWDHAFDNPAFDNGLRKDQYTATADLVIRF